LTVIEGTPEKAQPKSPPGFSFRKLFSDVALYSSGNLLIKGMSLISAPIFTRIFDPAQYGAWSFINVMIAFLTGILLLGGDNAYTRYFFKCKSDQERQALTATWFSFLAVWSIVVLVSVLPFSRFLSAWMLGSENYLAAWVIGLASSPLAMINLILSQALRNRFRAKAFTVLNIITAALTITLAVLFVLVFNLGVAGALLGAALASLVMLPVRVWFVRDLLAWSFSVRLLKQLLAFGLPLVPMNIAFWLFSNADRLMLARIADLESVGLYSISAAMAAALMLLQNAVGQSWLPHAMKIYEENEEYAREIFSRTMVFFLAGSGFVVTGFVALAQEVLFVLVPPAYYASFWAIPMLAVGFLFFTSAHITSVVIMVKNKTVYIMIACWVVAVVNIGLNSLLIPNFGIVGAGAATGISYIFFAWSYALISKRLWKVNYPVKTVAILLALPVISVALVTLIAYYGPDLGLNLVMKLIVLACCGLLLTVVAGRSEGKSLKELFRLGLEMIKREK
jgi:O-antigen/teichoic acid export membrane protein